MRARRALELRATTLASTGQLPFVEDDRPRMRAARCSAVSKADARASSANTAAVSVGRAKNISHARLVCSNASTDGGSTSDAVLAPAVVSVAAAAIAAVTRFASMPTSGLCADTGPRTGSMARIVTLRAGSRTFASN